MAGVAFALVHNSELTLMTTILITGANRGIGLELTRRYLAAGNNVIATCRNPEESSLLTGLRDQTQPAGQLECAKLEVTSADDVNQLTTTLTGRAIDVLINNAGVMGGDRQSLEDMDYDAWLNAFAINTIAPFRLIAALRENLRRAEHPRVITVSSQMGALSRTSKGSFAYRSSKAAVNKVMQVLALELEADGIICCPVHPGWVRTDMGGPQADISVEESAAGLIELIEGLTQSDSGRFWTYNGEEHSW